jgi:hypothetical protein
MSSETFAESAGVVVAAWETDGQVYFSRIAQDTGKRSPPVARLEPRGGVRTAGRRFYRGLLMFQ